MAALRVFSRCAHPCRPNDANTTDFGRVDVTVPLLALFESFGMLFGDFDLVQISQRGKVATVLFLVFLVLGAVGERTRTDAPS